MAAHKSLPAGDGVRAIGLYELIGPDGFGSAIIPAFAGDAVPAAPGGWRWRLLPGATCGRGTLSALRALAAKPGAITPSASAARSAAARTTARKADRIRG